MLALTAILAGMRNKVNSSLGSRTTQYAVEHPRVITRFMLVATVLLIALAGLPTLLPGPLGFLPEVTIDTDPENMLPADDPARVFHDQNKKRFGLHDNVILGVVNEEHPNGVFNPETLAKVYKLTEFVKAQEGVIVSDVLSLSTMDSIEPGEGGSVHFDWLMAEPPKTQEEATAIRTRAMRFPFLRDTLLSDDGMALVVYVPIVDKDIAHELSALLTDEIQRLGEGHDQFHIAGLPVAEDTFGIEMFIQMAISAPMAMVLIFALMWFFFRNFTVILSPMYVAMAAAMCTMALLIITGNTVHIMSSMIPIFIMPIAVLDGVHIISDFFDSYPQIRDQRKTIQKVMRHLFAPMLFTSLTTAAGFASLALTPIPPVQVFGIFVAIGVLLAWIFTILFIPAYLMLLPAERLSGFGRADTAGEEERSGLLGRLGRMRGIHAKAIIIVAIDLVIVAVFGIQKIVVNDNPTNWFESDHRIRVADRVLNKHFGGTYDAYLTLQYGEAEYTPDLVHKSLVKATAFESKVIGDVVSEFEGEIKKLEGTDLFKSLGALDVLARGHIVEDKIAASRVGWELVLDLLNREFEYADEAEEVRPADEEPPLIDTATLIDNSRLEAEVIAEAYANIRVVSASVWVNAPDTEAKYLTDIQVNFEGDDLATSTLDGFLARHEQRNEVFKDPALLKYVDDLQVHMNLHDDVGKSNSLVDIIKIVHRDLISGEEEDYRIPNNAEIVAQTLDQYQSSHRKDDLWQFVTDDFQKSVIWFQLKSGDNVEMQRVISIVDKYLADHPPPVPLALTEWFGLTYINVAWQNKMVSGMVNAMLGSFVIVLLMMIILFRSVLWGILSMIPLTLTVGLVYGILGHIGKDYDMPVAVLSSLSLGLAVDYSIHFLARARQLYAECGSWEATQVAVFEEPARAISKNVVVVGCGFLPLLLAPLVPYQTVGILIASMLLAAGLATLLILPALIGTFRGLLFRRSTASLTKE